MKHMGISKIMHRISRNEKVPTWNETEWTGSSMKLTGISRYMKQVGISRVKKKSEYLVHEKYIYYIHMYNIYACTMPD